MANKGLSSICLAAANIDRRTLMSEIANATVAGHLIIILCS